jgi:putative ABC transport system ATP-binding protein
MKKVNMAENVIEVQDLVKCYGEGEAATYALGGLSTIIRKGEFVAIMGPSGSGKSTLMNILGCLVRPTSGSYRLDGIEVGKLNRSELAVVRNEKVGFIFQSYNLLSRLTALQNVLLPMMYDVRNQNRNGSHEAHAQMLLDSVGLGNRLHHFPNQLSGGQQQRVAIARALANDPAIILADEPTGNLDSKSSQELMELLKHLHHQGATIVMVTHGADLAGQAERILHVSDGQIVDNAIREEEIAP